MSLCLFEKSSSRLQCFKENALFDSPIVLEQMVFSEGFYHGIKSTNRLLIRIAIMIKGNEAVSGRNRFRNSYGFVIRKTSIRGAIKI